MEELTLKEILRSKEEKRILTGKISGIEDEYYRFMSSHFRECPYYRSGDEYKIVRHQM